MRRARASKKAHTRAGGSSRVEWCSINDTVKDRDNRLCVVVSLPCVKVYVRARASSGHVAEMSVGIYRVLC